MSGDEYCSHTYRRRLPRLRTTIVRNAPFPQVGADTRRTPRHSIPVSGETTMTGQNGPRSRVSPGKFRQLGPVNWLVAAGRTCGGAPQMHLFTTLGYHGTCSGPLPSTPLRLLRAAAWRRYRVGDPSGRTPTILRIRTSSIIAEWRRQGLDITQADIRWPDVPDGDGPRKVLSARQQALLQATDGVRIARSPRVQGAAGNSLIARC